MSFVFRQCGGHREVRVKSRKVGPSQAEMAARSRGLRQTSIAHRSLSNKRTGQKAERQPETRLRRGASSTTIGVYVLYLHKSVTVQWQNVVTISSIRWFRRTGRWGRGNMDAANASRAQRSSASQPSANRMAPAWDEVAYPGLEDSTRLPAVRVALILVYGTIIALGVAGNALVIHVVFRFRRLRTVTNFFIANLALADLLVASLCLPFTLAYTLHGEWAFGRVLCFVLPCAQGAAVHVSTITLNVIAVDRLRSVARRPNGAPRMSRRTCAAVVAITWVVSALLASPLAIFREYAIFHLAPGESIRVCAEKWPEEGGSTPYSLAMMLLQYSLPLAVNTGAYACIWSKMNASRLSRTHRRRRKTTKMLMTVVAVFAVSWLPLHAFQLAVDIDSRVVYMDDFKLLFSAFHVVAMCSTFVNPILYGWMNSNYRSAFLDVCRCYRPFNVHKKMKTMASAPAYKSSKF